MLIKKTVTYFEKSFTSSDNLDKVIILDFLKEQSIETLRDLTKFEKKDYRVTENGYDIEVKVYMELSTKEEEITLEQILDEYTPERFAITIEKIKKLYNDEK